MKVPISAPKSEPAVARPQRRRPTPDQRRERNREKHWPNSSSRIWSRKTNDGFATIPRLLPLIVVLIRELSQKSDPSSVYWDLWARVYDQAFIVVKNPRELAFSSGYSGQRAVRTWTERMRELKALGFVDFKPRTGSEIGYVLMINPLHRASELHAEGRVSDDWWNAFVERAEEIGAELPGDSSGD